jgi:hypothetical protein
MPYGFLKATLRRGQSFPLKRSVLDAALSSADVMKGIQWVFYCEWKPSVPNLQILYTGEDHKWAGRGMSEFYVYAVPSAERKMVELLMLDQGLPLAVRWLGAIAGSGNTVRGHSQNLVLTVRDERLESRSSVGAV